MAKEQPEVIHKTLESEAAVDRKERVRVWPDLVLRETVAALAAVIVLMVLAIFVAAPLEEIADPSFSMNPSKAPWYFIGLQELLVYFTPWIAGVAIPAVVIIGLMAIPYLDVGKRSLKDAVVFMYERQIHWLFSISLGLWTVLTVIGLFFRGPNWSWQWPNGIAIGNGSHSIHLNWLLPLVIVLYIGAFLLNRSRNRQDKSAPAGFIRHFFSHLLTITGLSVTIKIAVYNLLDFMLK
jgi:hypothetical protein